MSSQTYTLSNTLDSLLRARKPKVQERDEVALLLCALDKLLVCAAMIVLVEMGRIPSWIVIIIISREFIISGFRLIASDNGVVIAASYWGKFKTVFQMIMICLMIANISFLSIITDIVMWIALVLTVVSLLDYLNKNKDVMKDTK